MIATIAAYVIVFFWAYWTLAFFITTAAEARKEGVGFAAVGFGTSFLLAMATYCFAKGFGI